MKKLLIFSLLVLAITIDGFSQSAILSLTPAIFIQSYSLQVGYNTTTVLIFPAAVKPGDKGKGDADLIVRKQPGSENILKVKAGRKNFTPTSLHVITGDG